MTHLAWAPPEWQEAARETLAGLAERHPSRTLLLFPQDDDRDALDADVSLQCFPLPELERHVCTEVIELRLRGEPRARAGERRPAARAPRPAGLPALARAAAVRRRGVRAARRRRRPARRRLARVAGRSGLLRRGSPRPSSASPSPTSSGRGRCAGGGRSPQLWPRRRDASCASSDPRPEAALLAGWLRSRLDRDVVLRHARRSGSSVLELDGREVRAAGGSAEPERPPLARARPLLARPGLRRGGSRASAAPLAVAGRRRGDLGAGAELLDDRPNRRARSTSDSTSGISWPSHDHEPISVRARSPFVLVERHLDRLARRRRPRTRRRSPSARARARTTRSGSRGARSRPEKGLVLRSAHAARVERVRRIHEGLLFSVLGGRHRGKGHKAVSE